MHNICFISPRVGVRKFVFYTYVQFIYRRFTYLQNYSLEEAAFKRFSAPRIWDD